MISNTVLFFSSCHVYGGSEKLLFLTKNILSFDYSIDFLLVYPKDVRSEVVRQNDKIGLNFIRYVIDPMMVERKSYFRYFLVRFLAFIGFSGIWNFAVFFFTLIGYKKKGILVLNSGGFPGARLNRAFYLAARIFYKRTSIIWVSHGFAAKRPFYVDKRTQFLAHSKANCIRLSKLGFANIEHFPSHYPIQKTKQYPSQIIYDLVLIGYLEQRKGHLVFLEKFYEQILQNNLSVAIVGDGPEFKSINNFISNSGCEGNISLLGYREDYLDILSSSKVLVHPSVGSEDMPLIIIEALGLGCTIVSSKIAGLGEYLIDEHNSYILDDDINLSQIVHMDLKRRLELSNNARDTYKRYFSKESYRDNWINLLNKCK